MTGVLSSNSPSAARWTWGRSLGFALGSGTKLRVSAAPHESLAIGASISAGHGVHRSASERPAAAGSPSPMRNFVLPFVGNLPVDRSGHRPPRWTPFPAGHGVHRSESNSHPLGPPSPYHPPPFA